MLLAQGPQVVEVDRSVGSPAFTTTTCIPAITAEAAFVPWADDGIRQTVRPSSPLARW